MKLPRPLLASFLATVCLGGAYSIGVARAGGVPKANALTYAGYVEDASGTPLSGPQQFALRVYDKASGGTARCESDGSQKVSVTKGHFEIPLPDECAAAVQDTPDLWVEISLAGEPLGRKKIGAVPYALEAGAASAARGGLLAQIEELVTKVNGVKTIQFTDWAPYSPSVGTFNGNASAQISLNQAFWRREGDSVRVRATVTVPNGSGTGVSVSLPPGVAPDMSKIPSGGMPMVGVSSLNVGAHTVLNKGNCASAIGTFAEGSSVTGTIECFLPVAGWSITSP